MASAGSLSSESDPFDVAELRRSGRGRRSASAGAVQKKALANRVDALASTLQVNTVTMMLSLDIDIVHYNYLNVIWLNIIYFGNLHMPCMHVSNITVAFQIELYYQTQTCLLEISV